MALTAYQVITGNDLDELERNVLAAALIDDKLVYGSFQFSEALGQYYQTMLAGDVAEPGEIANTGYSIIGDDSHDGLIAKVLEAADTMVPYGGASYNEAIGKWYQQMIIGSHAGAVAP